MDNLILNVDEYNDNELEKLLNLNNKYTLKDIEINSKKLKLNIENINITNQKKLEIKFFIDVVCSKLKNKYLNNNLNNVIINGSHVIQQDVNHIIGKNSKITEGRISGESEYNPGYINPINVRTISCVMNIDTRFRENYYKTKSTDFVLHLPEIQRKVVSFRISSIEMPMSFYAVKRENNNSTFIIRESIETHAPPNPNSYLSLEYLNENISSGNNISSVNNISSGNNISALQGNNVFRYTTDAGVNYNTLIIPDGNYGINDLNTELQNLIVANGHTADIIVLSGNYSTMRVQLKILHIAWRVDFQDANSNNFRNILGFNSAEYSGAHGSIFTAENTSTILLNNIDSGNIDSGNIDSGVSINRRIITLTKKYNAWLVVLEDGNYELDWQKKSKSSSLVTSMNNAISNAIPGVIDQNGRFGAYITPLDVSSLDPRKDIAFNVDRVSGRSLLAIPSTTALDATGSVFKNNPFTIDFAVDYAGNRNLSENIQMHLGWKLGFRAGQYSNALSIISEGICSVSGPKYAFISIDDGQKSSGTTFLAAYSNSSMDKNIISRLNLSTAFDKVGAYKSGSDDGLSIQLNRNREYFGPVNISRLHIKILDEFGRVLDLNNMDWSMSLIFNILYD